MKQDMQSSDINETQDTQTSRRRIKAHIFALITAFIWGNTYMSTKILLTDFTPMEIMVFRFIIAYLALLLLKPKRIPFNSLREELLFAEAGFCGVVLYFTLQNTSLVYTLVSNVGVLISIAPFFIAILSWFLLKDETLNKNFFIGFGFAIVGVAMISFNGNFILKLNPLGDILAISCAAAWAVYSIIMKKISAYNYDVILCTRKVFFYGLVLMIPVLTFFDMNWNLERFTYLPSLFHMLLLGLGASALCFVTWNYALSVLGAVKSSVYIYLSPIVTVLSSAIVLNEPFTLIAAIGIILIMLGLFLSEMKSLRSLKIK